jgi:hypothetical protein
MDQNLHQLKVANLPKYFSPPWDIHMTLKTNSMRKLLLNSILWALDAENKIPENGVNADPVETYEPSNSGFGQKYKKGVKLVDLER